MALGATMYVFDVRLADADRGVYETLTIRAARHPSESAEFLVTRLLAYCLEYTEGIAFSKGLSEPDDPAISVRDLTGALQTWIEVGVPDAARVHKAAKAAPKVTIYPHRDVEQYSTVSPANASIVQRRYASDRSTENCWQRWSPDWIAGWISTSPSPTRRFIARSVTKR